MFITQKADVCGGFPQPDDAVVISKSGAWKKYHATELG